MLWQTVWGQPPPQLSAPPVSSPSLPPHSPPPLPVSPPSSHSCPLLPPLHQNLNWKINEDFLKFWCQIKTWECYSDVKSLLDLLELFCLSSHLFGDVSPQLGPPAQQEAVNGGRNMGMSHKYSWLLFKLFVTAAGIDRCARTGRHLVIGSDF